MFKIGDEVRILDAEHRDYYKQILTKKGKIAQITNYKHFADDVERTKYYVEIPEFQNEFQSEGLWVFHYETSIALTSHEVTCDKMDAYEYAIQCFENAKVSLNRDYIIKGDDKMKILEIYAERKRKKTNEKYDKLQETIQLTDARYKVWKNCVDTLDELYKQDKILSNHHFAMINLSEDTLKMLEINNNLRRAEHKKLDELMDEVHAQMIMCTTYEQQQNILRTYKIIRENGKVNA